MANSVQGETFATQLLGKSVSRKLAAGFLKAAVFSNRFSTVRIDSCSSPGELLGIPPDNRGSWWSFPGGRVTMPAAFKPFSAGAKGNRRGDIRQAGRGGCRRRVLC